MPQKPKPKPPKPPRKDGRKRQPNQWGGNSFRLSFARRMFARGSSYSEVRTALLHHFKVHKTTAEHDIAEAKRRNELVTEKKIPQLIAESDVVLDVITDLAIEEGKYNDAVAARRELHRIHGMHAAKKVHVSADINVTLDINAMVAVLSDAGRAAYELVLSEIDAAIARGELGRAQPPLLPAGDEDSDEAN